VSFGVYLHIPFCEQHCHYCAFPVVVAPESRHQSYVESLQTEIELAELPPLIDTLYLGGGTPSLLTPEALSNVLEPVPRGACEVTIEANPGTLTRDRLEAYGDLGINRLSLGVQSFDSKDLLRAGRLHRAQDSVSDLEALRSHGFQNVSIDLIAGLPEQEQQAWIKNLDWVARLSPDHVSIYLLEADDSSLWGKKPPESQSDENYAWFYREAADRLALLGYTHYEISNWARPGAECRHNIGYWNGSSYRGLGLGAHSLIEGKRFWNTRSMSDYRGRIASGQLPIDEVEELTARIRLEEAFLLGLRRVEGFDVRGVAKDLGIDYPQEWFDRVDALVHGGLVEFDEGILKLTLSGQLLANGITQELLCPTLLSICEATP
jgi:oxygen-independent coproporphyrinogen-3 oxidase